MRTAFVTGVAGQDGLYLAELLVSKGYRVIGSVRSSKQEDIELPSKLSNSIELVSWDMRNQSDIIDILSRFVPHEVYNLAAYSSGSGMYEDAVDISEVNGTAITRILEAIRTIDTNIRFCQASSREIFGEAKETPQTELTMLRPRSPYGAAKQYADAMVRIYRDYYGIFSCSAILFNHESPRRKTGFVSRKITHTAAKIKLGLANELCIGNLDAQRDWGFAGDYVRAMWLMMQQETAEDYVISTGKAHSVRTICDLAFSYLGLDYRDYVREDEAEYRPAEPTLLVGSSDKARAKLGWEPKTSFKELVHMMVDADLYLLQTQIAKSIN